MSDELKADLQEIDGVGKATAEKIMTLLAEHDLRDSRYLTKAREAAMQGDDRQAAVYLRRDTAAE